MYPYCIHGSYVGGCGVDWMCHACEMGDEAPTISEIRSAMRYAYSRGAKRFELGAILALTPFPGSHPERLLDHLVGEAIGQILRLRAQIEEIWEYAVDEEDRYWIYRRHEKRVEEWEALEGEDQFWSLPDHVLDGA